MKYMFVLINILHPLHPEGVYFGVNLHKWSLRERLWFKLSVDPTWSVCTSIDLETQFLFGLAFLLA